MRNLSEKQPKHYWKILNGLKRRKKANPPDLNDLYNYFKDLNTSDYNDEDIPPNVIFQNENNQNCLNAAFTEAEILRCIKNLKNNKSPGLDGVLNEYIKSTSPKLLSFYAKYFNLILSTGYVPSNWSDGVIIPIYKNKGDSNDPGNYRPITLLSCVGKLFTSVLNCRLNTFLSENNILKENQAGFRSEYSTTDHIFTLNSIIEILRFHKKRLFCAYIDFSKAFDSVWCFGMWQKLLRNNINGNFSE